MFTQGFEESPLLRPSWTKTVRKVQGKSYWFCSATQGEVEQLNKNPNSFQCIAFSDEWSLSLHDGRVKLIVAWCCKQAKMRDLGLHKARNRLWFTADFSNPNALVRYFQNWGNRSLYFWRHYYYWRQIQEDVKVVSFCQACQLLFRHNVLTALGSPSPLESSQTVFRPKASNHVHGMGLADSVACTVSWADSCDFLLWSCLKDPEICKHLQNILDLN